MKVLTMSVLAASLLGTASSFAQTPTTDQSPAFGYPSYAGANSAARLPTTSNEGTYAPDFKGYTDPNTSPTTTDQTRSLNSEKRTLDIVGP
jgi:hypothetical protein